MEEVGLQQLSVIQVMEDVEVRERRLIFSCHTTVQLLLLSYAPTGKVGLTRLERRRATTRGGASGGSALKLPLELW
eukprot:scaffold402_cov217-Chaetoceros_neogracile.AAC.2